ncbi:MAG: hypothetical protein FJ398_18440 [Verrucomicrobia bacterium]|nr:hypothetical protein [Verrucomicrobiota bacterium]
MNDLKFAFRQLLKNPGFTFVAVSSLAVGLALATATFAMVNAYLIRSLPYPTAERVYHVMYAPPGPYEPRGMSEIDWRSLGDVLEDTITPSSATFYVMDDGVVKTFRGLRVPPGFIRGLGVQPVIDVRQGYDDADLRDIYLPFLQVPGRFASVHVRATGAASRWEQRIRAAAIQLEPFV